MIDIKDVNNSLGALAMVLKEHRLEINEVKNMVVDSQNFEEAVIYRNVEQALDKLIEAIETLRKEKL